MYMFGALSMLCKQIDLMRIRLCMSRKQIWLVIQLKIDVFVFAFYVIQVYHIICEMCSRLKREGGYAISLAVVNLSMAHQRPLQGQARGEHSSFITHRYIQGGQKIMARPRKVVMDVPANELSNEFAPVHTTNAIRRYSLSLPTDVYEKLEELADERGTTILALLRQFIRLGVLAAETDLEDPENGVFIRTNGKDTRLLI